MADRQFYNPKCQGNKHVILSFQLVPNGTSTPTLGEGAASYVRSVARTGVGVYTVTLSDKYAALVSAQVTYQLNAAAATLGIVTGAANGGVVAGTAVTLTTMTEAAGTFAAADIAANANNRIHVQLVLRNGGVTP